MRRSLLLCSILIALVAGACRSGPGVTMWGPCTRGDDPTGTDGNFAMVCEGGEWIPVMTVGEWVRVRSGEPDVRIAPLPGRPSASTSTTTVAPTTTAAPTTTTTTPLPAPTIVSVTPLLGPASGGTTVVITGAGFTGTTAVSFGGVDASAVTVDSDSRITVTSPAHAAGVVDVVLTAPGGTATAAGAFTYGNAPQVTTFSTNAVSHTGSEIWIVGSSFTGTTSVMIGDQSAPFTVDNDGFLSVITPPGDIGPKTVTITNEFGQWAISDYFSYN